jgi:hypothetical protein
VQSKRTASGSLIVAASLSVGLYVCIVEFAMQLSVIDCLYTQACVLLLLLLLLLLLSVAAAVVVVIARACLCDVGRHLAKASFGVLSKVGTSSMFVFQSPRQNLVSLDGGRSTLPIYQYRAKVQKSADSSMVTSSPSHAIFAITACQARTSTKQHSID